jgi:GntR family transcriptional regulator/MocR family aminotransferase
MMEPLFELHLDRPATGSREASQTLYSQLKEAIRDGRLAEGTRLPATRKSERYFGVSRNTAAEVYEQLRGEGYVIARAGSGTFVAKRLPAGSRSLERSASIGATYPLNAFWERSDVMQAMGFWQDATHTPRRSGDVARIDFRPGLVDWSHFPFEIYRSVSARQLRGLERKPPTNKSPQGNQGSFTLRAAIAKHIAVTRAVACDPDDILVTCGAQQGFDVLARTLVTAGQTVVAIEDPGYPPMRVAFAAAGAQLIPVGVDAEGLIVEQLPRDTRIISLCPSHQFPLGVTMSARRRQELIEFAHRHGAVIVEDDYDGEFRFEGQALTALRASAAADSVFYVGTFSKCMLPAFRLGFVVAPAWAMRTLVSAKNCMDWHTSTPTQAAVARFIADGHLTRHVQSMRAVYGQRRALLLELLKTQLSEWLEPLPSFYGMHLTALARASANLEAAVKTLQASQVQIHALDRYYLGPARYRGFVFGYGAVDLPELIQGISAVRRAFRQVR